MNLEAGSRLGIYTVIGPLGKGGMGEVYRARDTKLEREVAVKVLPDAMAHDSERVARFEREAKLLASLNHPQIAAIYGFEQADENRFLVLELIEGPTLGDLLAKAPLPVEEALEVGKQIAEALEAAHEKGIIHRDLKPNNVKFTANGQVKVLDFGLAKALVEENPEVDPGDSTSGNSALGGLIPRKIIHVSSPLNESTLARRQKTTSGARASFWYRTGSGSLPGKWATSSRV